MMAINSSGPYTIGASEHTEHLGKRPLTSIHSHPVVTVALQRYSYNKAEQHHEGSNLIARGKNNQSRCRSFTALPIPAILQVHRTVQITACAYTPRALYAEVDAQSKAVLISMVPYFQAPPCHGVKTLRSTPIKIAEFKRTLFVKMFKMFKHTPPSYHPASTVVFGFICTIDWCLVLPVPTFLRSPLQLCTGGRSTFVQGCDPKRAH